MYHVTSSEFYICVHGDFLNSQENGKLLINKLEILGTKNAHSRTSFAQTTLES